MGSNNTGRGGRRAGAGRKLIGNAPLKNKTIRMSDEEYLKVKEYLKNERERKMLVQLKKQGKEGWELIDEATEVAMDSKSDVDFDVVDNKNNFFDAGHIRYDKATNTAKFSSWDSQY